jgi:hypothetical protein
MGISQLFSNRLEKARDLPEIFELVKDTVQVWMGISRCGLMLGLADLGSDQGHWIGGLYPVATNVIVMNKRPLNVIKVMKPEMYNPYVYHILLHEYLHSLGILDEDETRRKALEVSKGAFGDSHMATQIARDISTVLPYATYPGQMPMPPGVEIELVKGFDRSSTISYIN